MSRPRLPHLHKDVSRHGAVRWYVRFDKGKRHRVPGVYGSAEFLDAYRRIVAGEEIPKRGRPITGSLSWLVERYRESLAWRDLAPATRRARERILRAAIERAGNSAAGKVTRKTILDAIDRRRETPFAAANFLKTMRGLFGWAADSGLVEMDPTAGIRIKAKKSAGFQPWSAADLEAFRTRWPAGTRERLAFDLFLHTGLRRGDVARLGLQHLTSGVIEIRTEKTGELVTLPISPELRASIEATPRRGLHLIEGLPGRPMTKESLGNWFRVACDAAGVKGKSAHGIRKAAATIAAEAGATEKELDAMFGWSGGGMAKLYTRAADRARLARAGLAKVEGGKSGTSIPSPSAKAPSPEKNNR